MKTVKVYRTKDQSLIGEPLELSGILLDAAFAPDDTQLGLLVTEVEERTERELRMFQAGAGKLVIYAWQEGTIVGNPVAMPSEPRCIRYSPDGRYIGIMCAASEVRVLHSRTGELVTQFRSGSSRHEIHEFVNNGKLRFSPDGQWIVTWGMDGEVEVWDVLTGSARYPALRHRKKCHGVEFSSDGRLLVTSGYDEVAMIWDFETGKPAASPLKHPGWVFAAKFSPDGRRILTACRDGSARLWDWRLGELLCPPMTHEGEVMDVDFTPDGRWLLTASHDGTARAWAPQTGKPITPSMPLGGMGWQLELSPSGRHAVIAGRAGALRVMDLDVLYDDLDLSDDALCTFAELISGQELHPGGGINKLTQEEWLDRWHRLEEIHPEMVGLLESPISASEGTVDASTFQQFTHEIAKTTHPRGEEWGK